LHEQVAVSIKTITSSADASTQRVGQIAKLCSQCIV
jgi:hypothetical protein